MNHPIVLIDANILFSPAQRDIIIELANAGLFQARWTEKIHEEWMHAVRKQRPDLPEEVVQKMKELINQSVPDCLVTDYENLIDDLQLSDPDDRHVLAAAIKGNCKTILTRNFRDFPAKKLRPYNVTAQTPQEFLKQLLENHRQPFVTCLHNILKRFPNLSTSEYAQVLKKNQLKRIAEVLEN